VRSNGLQACLATLNDILRPFRPTISTARASLRWTPRLRSGRVAARCLCSSFNNRFDDAVYRLAQIVHDSQAPVIPVLFPWPSRGERRLCAYTYDRESANFSRDALDRVLSALDGSPAVSEVYLLAHSMGNWIALEALRTRAIRGSAVASKRSKLKMRCWWPPTSMSMSSDRSCTGWVASGRRSPCFFHATTARLHCPRRYRETSRAWATSIRTRSLIEASCSAIGSTSTT